MEVHKVYMSYFVMMDKFELGIKLSIVHKRKMFHQHKLHIQIGWHSWYKAIHKFRKIVDY